MPSRISWPIRDLLTMFVVVESEHLEVHFCLNWTSVFAQLTVTTLFPVHMHGRESDDSPQCSARANAAFMNLNLTGF